MVGAALISLGSFVMAHEIAGVVISWPAADRVSLWMVCVLLSEAQMRRIKLRSRLSHDVARVDDQSVGDLQWPAIASRNRNF